MTRSLNFLFAVTTLFLGAKPSYATQDTATAHVRTSGWGEVSLVPDWAFLHIGVGVEDSTAAGAGREASRRLLAIVSSLRGLGFVEEEVSRTSYVVAPRFAYDGERRLVAYGAQANVRVRIDSLSRLGSVVDTALAAGATQVPRIEFHANEEADARASALRAAMEEARAMAATLASAAGRTLGALVEIRTSDRAPSRFSNIAGGTAVYYEQVALDLRPQDVLIRVGVQADWRLRD